MRALAAALLVALALPGAASGASQTTLTDLEDEVMCPICGTLLELAEAPQADEAPKSDEAAASEGAEANAPPESASSDSPAPAEEKSTEP